MNTHQKHANLVKPTSGQFHRHEWGILGTSCSEIRLLIQKITQSFPGFRMGYLDAAHRSGDQPLDSDHLLQSAGLEVVVTDHIHYREWQDRHPMSDFDWKIRFHDLDVLWINGNHFPSQYQIIVIDPAKEHSLKKRLDRIKNIELILLKENDALIPALLTEHPAYHPAIPVIALKDETTWMAAIKSLVVNTIPDLSGMVLIGGKSSRMGKDKAEMNYHGLTQKDYLYQLLDSRLDQVFFSVRPGQESSKPSIEDAFSGLGPFGAILSYFQKHPDDALLVTACDLPGIHPDSLDYLIAHRDPTKMATAFLNPETGFADPLFTIYEPKIYQRMLQFLAMGYSCPRKVLINSDIQLLEVPDPDWLQNVNTPEDFANYSVGR